MFSKIKAYLRKPSAERMPIDDWAAEIARHPEALKPVLESCFKDPVIRNLYEDAQYFGRKKLKIKFKKIDARHAGTYNATFHRITLNAFRFDVATDEDFAHELKSTFIHELRHAWQYACSGIYSSHRSDPYTRFVAHQISEMDAFAFENRDNPSYYASFYEFHNAILHGYAQQHYARVRIPLPVNPVLFNSIASACIAHTAFYDAPVTGGIALSILSLFPALKLFKNYYESYKYNDTEITDLFNRLTYRDETGTILKLFSEQDIKDGLDFIKSIYHDNALSSPVVRALHGYSLRLEDYHKLPAGRFLGALIA